MKFPDVETASEEGIVAVGGDLSPERLLLAYRSGLFPWYSEDEPILWWSPNPRFVLFPKKIKIAKSMKPLFNKKAFEITINTDFGGVMQHCRNAKRQDWQSGETWISDEIIAAYATLHTLGYAHSIEARQNGKLVGGLYGIALGACFFGESMFALVPNASKYAFITLAKKLNELGFLCIDCQIYSEHLESLGAELIERQQFINILKQTVDLPIVFPTSL